MTLGHAIALALLLGARHATEPDHLTAVSTLALDGGPGRSAPGRADRSARSSGWWLGLAWGGGHAATLLALGVPVVLLGVLVPDGLQRAAESLVGVLIAALAVRLLVRWHRGYFHVHPHRHGEGWHAHPHVHERAPRRHHPAEHDHRHGRELRSPLASFGLGLVHGIGGSGGAVVLLVGSRPDRAAAVASLVAFAASAAVAMALFTGLWATLLARPAVAHRLERLVPALAVATLAFGLTYATTAWT